MQDQPAEHIGLIGKMEDRKQLMRLLNLGQKEQNLLLKEKQLHQDKQKKEKEMKKVRKNWLNERVLLAIWNT